jgi:lysophospholipase L1-like esterase
LRRVLAAVALAGCGLCAIAGCSGPTVTKAAASSARHAAPRDVVTHDAAPVSYYLALGDSLSQGVQPNASGASVETQQGYPNQLYALLRRSQPGLRLVKLGCPGETTGTMLHGGICSYHGGSQLAAATSFLRAHRGHVSLITIDIGANDPNSCITRPIDDLAICVGKKIPTTTANLTRILTRLRDAAPRARIIGMNYYLPELAEWRHGVAGEVVARLVLSAAVGYNKLLARVYQRFGARVANVFSAFHTSDFSQDVTLPRFGRLPRNVATICQWTWECAAPPRGPNEHANQAGYQVIAHAFLVADER